MSHEDIEGIQSDLHALRKLYGLLQTNGRGLRDEISDLDEKARLLLKNLLDSAAERVFEAHSEIISTHIKDTLKQQPSNLANVLSQQISPTFVQSTAKCPSPENFAVSNKKDGRIRTTMVRPGIGKPLTTIQRSPDLEQSKPSFSASTPENRRKKRCRVCRQSSVKQLKPTEELILPSKETQNPSKDVISLQPNQLYNLPADFHFGNNEQNKGIWSSNKAIYNSARSVERQKQRRNISEFKRRPYDPACIDKEAYDAIEQIESCIAALQKVVVLAKQVGSQEKKKLSPQLGLHANSSIIADAKLTNLELRETKFSNQSMNGTSSSAIQKVEKNKGVSSDYDVLNQSVPGQNVKAILEKIESLRWVVASQNNYMPTKFLSQINDENFDRNRIAQKVTMKKGETTSQLLISSVGSTGPDRRIRTTDRATTQRGKGLPDQTSTRQTLVDHKYIPISYEHHQADQERSLVQRRSHVGPRRVISPYQVESSDGLSLSLRTSSDWTSYQASISSSGSGSEEYSTTPSEHYMSPSTGSESDVYSLPDKTRGHYAGPTSSSDSVPSTTRAQQVGSTSSNESGGYLSSDQASTHHCVGGTTYRTADSTSTSRRIGPRKNGSWRKPGKQIGRLRKLKDKLAIIFHHHHHHHHHHHDDDRYDHGAKIRRGRSLFKNRTSRDKDFGEKAVEKVRKAAVRNVADKKQRGHLRMLVEGLLNHLRHSRKSRPSKVGIGRLENGHRVGKKGVKNLHWWQMLRHHRGGVKVPNKQRAKLGLSAKRPPQVKALPKMR
ncbi:hypothetical protein LguiA_013391 [Lonicera macranthoides]